MTCEAAQPLLRCALTLFGPQEDVKSPVSQCPLSYPDRFTEASSYVSSRKWQLRASQERDRGGPQARPRLTHPGRPCRHRCRLVVWLRGTLLRSRLLAVCLVLSIADGGSLSEESKLLLYSLHQQATVVGAAPRKAPAYGLGRWLHVQLAGRSLHDQQTIILPPV